MGRARRRVNLARPPIPAQSKQMTKTVRIFRWIVFLLAAGYCLRTLAFSSFEHFAGPFRYLTIWALFMSFFAASRMMALVEGRSTCRGQRNGRFPLLASVFCPSGVRVERW
jgi:hypothetical protein